MQGTKTSPLRCSPGSLSPLPHIPSNLPITTPHSRCALRHPSLAAQVPGSILPRGRARGARRRTLPLGRLLLVRGLPAPGCGAEGQRGEREGGGRRKPACVHACCTQRGARLPCSPVLTGLCRCPLALSLPPLLLSEYVLSKGDERSKQGGGGGGRGGGGGDDRPTQLQQFGQVGDMRGGRLLGLLADSSLDDSSLLPATTRPLGWEAPQTIWVGDHETCQPWHDPAWLLADTSAWLSPLTSQSHLLVVPSSSFNAGGRLLQNAALPPRASAAPLWRGAACRGGARRRRRLLRRLRRSCRRSGGAEGAWQRRCAAVSVWTCTPRQLRKQCACYACIEVARARAAAPTAECACV